MSETAIVTYGSESPSLFDEVTGFLQTFSSYILADRKSRFFFKQMHDVVRTEKAGPGNRRNGQLFGQMSSYVIHDLHDFFIFFVLMDITDFFIVDSLGEIYEEFRKNGLFQYIAGRPADGPGLTEPAGRAVYAACFLMLEQNRRGKPRRAKESMKEGDK